MLFITKSPTFAKISIPGPSLHLMKQRNPDDNFIDENRVEPYIRPDGIVVYHHKWRVFTAVI
jgi:hypothetical protein